MIRSVILSSFVALMSVSSFANDELQYGSIKLQERFVSYQSKHSECQAVALDNKLDDQDILKLSTFKKEAGIALGYYHFKAIEKCSQDEYLLLLTTLLSLEALNNEGNTKAISDQIDMIKKVLFIGNSFTQEMNLSKLPKDTIEFMSGFQPIKEPFNLFDAYDRAWPN